jgi:hypothetical protein
MVNLEKRKERGEKGKGRESDLSLRPSLFSLLSSRFSVLSPFKLPPHGVQRDPAGLQQHQKVIEEIGRLGRETLVILRIRRHDDLDAFLADLARDGGHPCVQQTHRVGPRRPVSVPVGNRRGESRQQMTARVGQVLEGVILPSGAGEARGRPRMAGGTGLGYPVQDRVTVAVNQDLPDCLDVPRRLPFTPKRGPGPAIVVGLSSRGRALQRLPIGVGDHQDVPGTALLRHHGDKSIGPEAHRG